jgi:hypothetical protein
MALLATTNLDNSVLSDIPASTWQQRFACQFHGLLNRPIRHAQDFPSFMLLDILRNDIIAFESLDLIGLQVLPVATHSPVITESLEERLHGLELTQSMIRKAERIHRLVTYMSDSRTLDLIANESRSDYEETLHRLEMGSLFLVSELKQKDDLANERLNVHNRFSQLR